MDVAPLTAPPAQVEPLQPAPGRRSWLQLVILGLLFVAVTSALVRGWSELASYQWEVNYAAALLALGLWVVTTLGAGCCWIVVTRAFGVRLPIARALRVFCTSNLGKYLPGKVLHVFARVYLVQQQGVALAVGTTSAMLDVLLYIAAGLVMGIFALPMAVGVMGGSQSGVLALSLAAVPIGLLLLHPRSLNTLLTLAARFVPRLRGLHFELRYRAILGAFALYLVQWLLVIAAVYAGVRSVEEVPLHQAPILGAVFALAYVVGLITPTPAGAGGREAVMLTLFQFFMPAPAAVVATLLNRLLQVIAEAICAGLLSALVREPTPQ
jgi:uncharacterized membrane protein YbhN (UPF0104 family)